ncbi:MAG: DUF554 domain-containing protein [Eubacteriales bacterium]|nr:DUF554 domain-containing protein [Eubacteriales bacterium]MDD3882149.1 DUF554 domain-containing protein [Eubacteriales bacterium]MDD4513254.1 DUF554 domain-containing protein [Eubacteriales bacterium]
MIGVLINVGAIILGSALGCLIGKGFSRRVREAVMSASAICVVVIGISGALKTSDITITIISVVLGALLGGLIGIEKHLDSLGEYAQKRLAGNSEGSGFANGFVTATLVFCVGAMAIVGSLDSGIRGDNSTLIAKSVLDGVCAMIFAGSMGIGVMLSALAVLAYQGAIALLGQLIAPIFTQELIAEMSAAGGIMIIGVGLNLLQIRKEKIPVGDMLPGIFMPALVLPVYNWISSLVG